MITNRFFELLKEKETREGRNIPITEVAKATGVSRRALQNWSEKSLARFDAPVIDALCCYLGCTPGDLIVIEDPCPPVA